MMEDAGPRRCCGNGNGDGNTTLVPDDPEKISSATAYRLLFVQIR
jgi:hypothetical protein